MSNLGMMKGQKYRKTDETGAKEVKNTKSSIKLGIILLNVFGRYVPVNIINVSED